MKTDSLWLIKLVSRFLKFLWFANNVLLTIGLVVLTIAFASEKYIDFAARVQHKHDAPVTALQSVTDFVQSITVQEKEAMIKMKVHVTPLLVVESYLLLAIFEVLLITILWNLRKVFASLKDQPFQLENVRRLKLTALCIALFTPFDVLFGWLNYMLFSHQVQGFNDHYMLVWTDSLSGIFVGAVLYIMADVFRYGFQLKKETEEFV